MPACTASPALHQPTTAPTDGTFLVTGYARLRFVQRFQHVARSLGSPLTIGRWLGRMCQRAPVFHHGPLSDLRTLTIRHADGPIELIFATRPDTAGLGQVLTTVLTRAQADAIIAQPAGGEIPAVTAAA